MYNCYIHIHNKTKKSIVGIHQAGQATQNHTIESKIKKIECAVSRHKIGKLKQSSINVLQQTSAWLLITHNDPAEWSTILVKTVEDDKATEARGELFKMYTDLGYEVIGSATWSHMSCFKKLKTSSWQKGWHYDHMNPPNYISKVQPVVDHFRSLGIVLASGIVNLAGHNVDTGVFRSKADIGVFFLQKLGIA